MTVTARALNRASLVRQLLVEREPLEVGEAVRRVVAVQAQHPASPYVALFNRVRDFDPAALDRAFAERLVVKSTLLRMTLHAVHADEHPSYRAAMLPAMAGARFEAAYAAGGLTGESARRLAARLARFAAVPRTGAELEAWLEQRLGAGTGAGADVWWAMRAHAPLLHAPTGGPWSFGQRPAYVAAPPIRRGNPARQAARGLEALTRRYLEAFGPATVADLAQFAKLPRNRVTEALRSVRPEELPGPGGITLYDVPGGARPPEDLEVPPRLMAMWDSVLLAYDDRGRVVPPEYKQVVTRANGDVLPTLLVDGYVAGVWRPTDTGIEVTTFRPLPDATWFAIATEVRALSAVVHPRDPRVYRRYDYWWPTLPATQVVVLPREP